MNPPTNRPSSYLSVRFFRWLSSWRIMRRLLIAFGWLVTLIALFYGEENWRGRRAWNDYRQDLEARGEQLNFQSYFPAPVPDEQNFAAMPVIKGWFEQNADGKSPFWNDTNKFGRAVMVIHSPDRAHRYLIDFVAWEKALAIVESGQFHTRPTDEPGQLDREPRAKAAAVVLTALKENEPKMEELRAASTRGHAVYPVFYDLENPVGIRLPHLGQIHAICQHLQLRACAELAVGQSDNALADVCLMLYMADSLSEESLLISYLHRVACVQMAIQPIWEGLAEHRWSEAQLRTLQTRLQDYNFIAESKRSMDTERAMGISTVDLVRKKGLGLLAAVIDFPGTPTVQTAALVGKVIPTGWYYFEQLSLCQLFDKQRIGVIDPAKKTMSPNQLAENKRLTAEELSLGSGKGWSAIRHHRVLANLLLPSLEKVHVKAAMIQTVTDEATVACALERYRLASSHFPEKLEMLVPEFLSQLPHDTTTGQSYKYHRTGDNAFMLYSIGVDQTDNGGQPGRTLFDDTKGDWTWQHPANRVR